jgi:excisionase family DNA binding protein
VRKLQRKPSVTLEPVAGALRPLCVTIEEAAGLLSIGRTRVYQLITSGEIEMIKIGKSSRVTTESLSSFLARAAVRSAN